MPRYAQITGWGMYVPEKVLTNHDLEQMVDTSDEWITSRTGIKERHIVAPGEACSDLSIKAMDQALAVAGLAPTDVELVILGTTTPDYLMPGAVFLVQDHLGVRCPAFEIRAGCCGFMYGLVAATQFLATGACRNAVVIGTEIISTYLNWKDRNTCVLFGDGSGAVVLEATDTPSGILSYEMGADGSGLDWLVIPAFGTRYGVDPKAFETGDIYIHMEGKKVFRFAVESMVDVTRRVVYKAGLTMDDIDLLIPHQANARIIEYAAKMLRIPMEKVYVNIDRYGNTSAASIPIALVEAVQQGRIKDGDKVVLNGFGAGLTWATTLVQWGKVETQMLEAGFWQTVLGQARLTTAKARDLVSTVSTLIAAARSS